MIEIKNLSKSFGPKQVLNKVNASLLPGKTYGFVGENGAGKTTLFRCIADLEDYEGKITSEHKPLKNHLGLLTSEPYFIPKLTAEEYIYLLTDSRRITLKNLAERNIFQLPLKEFVSNYSTGMKKKLAITAVLLQNNEYFIFDEPYNGIDLESSIILTAIIHRLKALNKTIIISSHIFSTLKDTCDYIYKIENGTLSNSFEKENFHQLEDEMKEKVLFRDLEKLIIDY